MDRRFTGIVTDGGASFIVGQAGILQIEAETEQGALTGMVLVYKERNYVEPDPSDPDDKDKDKKPKPTDDPKSDKNRFLLAKVPTAKVDVFYIEE